jgi:hypothetical protein
MAISETAAFDAAQRSNGGHCGKQLSIEAGRLNVPDWR